MTSTNDLPPLQIHAIGPFDAEVEPPLGRYKAELVRAFNELRSLRSAVKSHQQPDLDNLISTSDLPGTFPPRKECDILIDGYLRTFEKIYRILHVPTFLEQYAQFWDNAEAVPKVSIMQLLNSQPNSSVSRPYYLEQNPTRRDMTRYAMASEVDQAPCPLSQDRAIM